MYSMTRLGIVAALSQEVRVLTRKTLPAGAVARLNDNVLVALSGIGPERAQAAEGVVHNLAVCVQASGLHGGDVLRRLTRLLKMGQQAAQALPMGAQLCQGPGPRRRMEEIVQSH